jgi:hypothetical protein
MTVYGLMDVACEVPLIAPIRAIIREDLRVKMQEQGEGTLSDVRYLIDPHRRMFSFEFGVAPEGCRRIVAIARLVS